MDFIIVLLGVFDLWAGRPEHRRPTTERLVFTRES